MLRSVRALLQFCTPLPLGEPVEFEAFARRTWLYPLAGYVVGGITALLVFWIPDAGIAAALSVALLLVLTGGHHFDGLLDFGDGLMAHGGMERRIAALTDRQTGAGGLAAGGAVLLCTFAGLSVPGSIPWALIAGEVGGKFSMLLLTVAGRPCCEGMHSYLHGFARPRFFVYGIILCLPLLLLRLPPAGLGVAAVLSVTVPLAMLAVARRAFGGVNGDVVGAAGEITRAAVIMGIAISAGIFIS
jgi:adenosylcobinamide-GDP ribazoletransferase